MVRKDFKKTLPECSGLAMALAPKGPSSPLVGYSNKTVSASERLFPATIYGH